MKYFHNHEYRHVLRDIPMAKYLKVRAGFLKAGLDLDGESPEHDAVINKVLGDVLLRSDKDAISKADMKRAVRKFSQAMIEIADVLIETGEAASTMGPWELLTKAIFIDVMECKRNK